MAAALTPSAAAIKGTGPDMKGHHPGSCFRGPRQRSAHLAGAADFADQGPYWSLPGVGIVDWEVQMAIKGTRNVDWAALLRSPAFALVAFTVVVGLVAVAYAVLATLWAHG